MAVLFVHTTEAMYQGHVEWIFMGCEAQQAILTRHVDELFDVILNHRQFVDCIGTSVDYRS